MKVEFLSKGDDREFAQREHKRISRTLLLALLCVAATLLFAAAALAQESGTEQYSESDYCEKRIGTKDAPFASPSYKGEWEYDAINACLAARQQEEAADPASCSEILENSYRFSIDRVEACQGQYEAEPNPIEQDDVRVDDPEAYPCTEILGSPDGATGIASNGVLRLYGEERVVGCIDQLEAEAASPDPCAGSLFADTFAGVSTANLGGTFEDLADPALVDPDGNGVICDSDEPADQEQYYEPQPVENPQAASCAEVLGPRPAPRTQGLVGEEDLVASGQKELYGEERVRECLDQLRAETAVFANPTSEDYGVCSQPLFAELYTGLSTDYLYALGGADVLNEKPADPDGNGIICDSTQPVAPAQPGPEETVPEERAQAPDLCAELSFAKQYAGRPVAEAPNPEDPSVDPDGTGVVCGHVLAEHGYVPFESEPETGRVLPRTGGPAVPALGGLLLGAGVLGAAALRVVARGR